MTFVRFRGRGFPDGADGEKFMAAGFTSQGRQSENATEEAHWPRNVFRGDTLEVKIAANGAMGVFQQADGYGAGTEANAARGAAPGNQTNGTIGEIGKAVSPRAPASGRVTRGTLGHFECSLLEGRREEHKRKSRA